MSKKYRKWWIAGAALSDPETLPIAVHTAAEVEPAEAAPQETDLKAHRLRRRGPGRRRLRISRKF